MATNIPIHASLTGAIGDVRLNSNNHELEIYDGAGWLPVNQSRQPKTWQEWFKYFGSTSIDGMDRYGMCDYIEKQMQTKFPGNYRVDLAGNYWDMIFDTPADETWFHLKYD